MQSSRANASLLYGVVLVLLLALGLLYFLRSSAFNVTEIQIQGAHAVQPQEVLRLAEVARGQNLLLLDQEALKRKVSLHPLVRTVQLQRKLPHTLIVRITERVPSALVLVSKGVIEVDSQGVFLRRLEGWPAKDYPVISGVQVPDTAGPGQTLALAPLQAALQLLGQAPAGLLPQIGELHVSEVGQMTLFLTSGVEVRLGHNTQWEEKLAALLALLNDPGYKSVENTVAYIDFTAAKPVIGRS